MRQVGSYLYRLDRFITARMMHLHFQDFILGQLDFLNGTDLGKVASDAEKQLRGAVSAMNAQGECFSTYFIEI
jgi:hypothetical protein